jgi:hypothetical protein
MRSVIGAQAATAAAEVVPPFCTPSPTACMVSSPPLEHTTHLFRRDAGRRRSGTGVFFSLAVRLGHLRGYSFRWARRAVSWDCSGRKVACGSVERDLRGPRESQTLSAEKRLFNTKKLMLLASLPQIRVF